MNVIHETMRPTPASVRPEDGAGYYVRAIDDETARAVALVSVQEAVRKVSDACAELARLGCLVLSAHAIPGRPRVLVMPPPAALREQGRSGIRRWDRLQEVHATSINGVQVEWCVRRSCAGGAA